MYADNEANPSVFTGVDICAHTSDVFSAVCTDFFMMYCTAVK